MTTLTLQGSGTESEPFSNKGQLRPGVQAALNVAQERQEPVYYQRQDSLVVRISPDGVVERVSTDDAMDEVTDMVRGAIESVIDGQRVLILSLHNLKERMGQDARFTLEEIDVMPEDAPYLLRIGALVHYQDATYGFGQQA